MPNLTVVDTSNLAQLVRTATARAHSSAENSPFIVALMGGELSLADYERYLAQYAWIYEALEARAHVAGDPAIIDPGLDRFASIEHDLAALSGDAGESGWRERHPMLPATAAYVGRLSGIDPTDLPRYLAHHYTRYLGDLSGGQAIARLVARHYGAREDQLSFYRFDGIDTVPFKREYREGLDHLGFDESQVATFLAEASESFRLNSALFADLAQ
jgi:heme oxygenase